MIVLKKKIKAAKLSDHFPLSLSAHTANIVARVLRRRIERKIVDVLGEEQFGFRRGKETVDSVGALRMIWDWTLNIDKELFVSFIDWEKVFDHVIWTKLMQILKGTGIDWLVKDWSEYCALDLNVKLTLDQGETRSVKIGRVVRLGCCLSPILFRLCREYLTKDDV